MAAVPLHATCYTYTTWYLLSCVPVVEVSFGVALGRVCASATLVVDAVETQRVLRPLSGVSG